MKKILFVLWFALLSVFSFNLSFAQNLSSESVIVPVIVNLPNATSSTSSKIFEEIKSIVQNKYNNATTAKNILENTNSNNVEDLLKNLNDKYTNYFNKEESKIFQETLSGKFSGIGAELGIINNQVMVIKILDDSPAKKYGLEAGDVLLAVGSTSLVNVNMTLSEIISMIRGKTGTTVNLFIKRLDKKGIVIEKNINIIRGVINLKAVETEIFENIFIIKIKSFSPDSAVEFKSALDKFKKSKQKYLLLDLRDNSGGYLEASVLIASFFIPKDQLIVSEEFVKENKSQKFYSKGFNYLSKNTKVLVWINKSSASASEILTKALQEYKIAKVVGEKSYGKGSVQELFNLPDGSSIKLTVANWKTGKGELLEGVGVTPDIYIYNNDKSLFKDIFKNWNNYPFATTTIATSTITNINVATNTSISTANISTTTINNSVQVHSIDFLNQNK